MDISRVVPPFKARPPPPNHDDITRSESETERRKLTRKNQSARSLQRCVISVAG